MTGSGHNGLSCACYLDKAKPKILVLGTISNYKLHSQEDTAKREFLAGDGGSLFDQFK